MHSYVIVDRTTGERTEVVAPNRDAALKAHVRRRLTVTRVSAKAAPEAKAEQWSQEELDRIALHGTPIPPAPSGTDSAE